jgi:hypothetical protein
MLLVLEYAIAVVHDLGIVTCQRIARQRLNKHPAIRARNNRTNVTARC